MNCTKAQQVQKFNHEMFGELEIWIHEGEEYFPAVDVATFLGYGNPYDALSKHCKQEGVAFREVPTEGGKQKKKYISEGNLYRLITKSQLPSAEKFELWVFDEVLPMIRKTGVYITDNLWEQIYNNPTKVKKLVDDYGEIKKELEENRKIVRFLTRAGKTYITTEIAKELGFPSANALNKDLHQRKIQYKLNGTWILFSKYADKGYMQVKQNVLNSKEPIYNSRWTQLGRQFLLSLYDA